LNSRSTVHPTVSVVIVNLNRAELLAQAVRSVLGQSFQDFEIIVVDNASVDDSAAAVQAFVDPRIHLLELKENRGFSGGANVGIRRARGRWIALLNNDAIAHRDWLSRMMEAARRNPAAGMLASRILFEDGRFIDKAGHLIFLDGQNRGRGTGQPAEGNYCAPDETLFPDGCAGLYRRKLIEETGGLDEDFFAYADDADLGLRARWLGWTCAYVPEAVVYHLHSATSGRYAPKKIFWVERNRVWLVLKNFPLPLLLLSFPLTLLRFSVGSLAALAGRGAAGGFRQANSFRTLIWTLLKADAAALAGSRRIWTKRRDILKARRIGSWAFFRILWKHRISLRELSFHEIPGDGSKLERIPVDMLC
jgi:GT2 family glycosyltransferase